MTVNGTKAQYWEREDHTPSAGNLSINGERVDGNSVETAPGITVTNTSAHSIHSKRASVLTWTRGRLYFRLIAPPDLDLAEMLRIADNVE